MTKFTGTGVALITPFKKNKSVDYDTLAKLIDYVTDGGVDFLVALGTTAETPTITSEEKTEILSFIIKHNAGKLPVMAGAGTNCTADTVKNVQSLPSGVGAALIVTPYYNKPSQKGLIEHFTAVADASPVPVFLYNVPGRTGINMTAETTLHLANHKNIAGIKEASGNIIQVSYILRNKPSDFIVVSGDDNITMPEIAIGINGVISVAANVYPKTFSEMVKLGLSGNTVKAAENHLKMIEAIDLLFAEGNPTGVKAALAIKGIVQNELRLPMVSASDELFKKIEKHNSIV